MKDRDEFRQTPDPTFVGSGISPVDYAGPEPNKQEPDDVSIAAIAKFIGALLVGAVAVWLLLAGLWRLYDKTIGPPQASSPWSGLRSVPSGIKLQVQANQELQDYLDSQAKIVNSYGTSGDGTFRMPVDKAIDLVVQRGLPARANAPAPPGMQPVQNAPAQQQELQPTKVPYKGPQANTNEPKAH